MKKSAPTILRCILALAAALPTLASAQLAPDTVRAIDAIVAKALEDKSVPSVSIAVVKDGKLAYAQAYGVARLDKGIKATPQMRYKIGSNTKQIVAAAILLLVQDGKVALEDKVARFLPDLTRSNEVSVRQLLAHTAGYPDYYPLDYVAPFMEQPTTVDAILSNWGKQPLGFDPASRWEYSNTGYAIAGRIIEIASGMPLDTFIHRRITDKLAMRSVVDTSATSWDEADPQGYEAAAFGPPRPARPEGRYWVWAAGNLAMTASDLARWDIALMHDAILNAASRKALSTENLLSDGVGTNYGLGMFVHATPEGRLRWDHGGEVSGFRSQNTLFPHDDTAIVVLTNGGGAASEQVTGEIASLLFAPAADSAAPLALSKVRTLFAQLQTGHPDRSMMSDALNAYFSDQVVADFAASLKPLGEVESIVETRSDRRGGLVYRFFRIKTTGGTVRVPTYFTSDGKLEQFIVYPR
ncbi:class A beta-lactamase-related serine hydrolase [Duganella sp. BJB488]|uniref:serine hydrolase domain-containing protein n=1 Tax=unclassified Duganella TaxID=2636909 RepID=UPI000E340F02|nr:MULTISPECIES: serine hydrolase domain-containing protein [unclassified Duganella]RFP17879.1 class A beta-lactamase-related serine hydrolase [Duganella sp. BJB489]RFP17965.1 class A beta-lactamase-related serine hydrolase [Duganella sp. BJB488]RFP37720.1 class A beta-lactamase-related serine hydrolase [Duganella sp. BJB480]